MNEQMVRASVYSLVRRARLLYGYSCETRLIWGIQSRLRECNLQARGSKRNYALGQPSLNGFSGNMITANSPRHATLRIASIRDTLAGNPKREACELASNCTRQSQIPGHSPGVHYTRRAGHRQSVCQART